jgi:hypothetical protein
MLVFRAEKEVAFKAEEKGVWGYGFRQAWSHEESSEVMQSREEQT